VDENYKVMNFTKAFEQVTNKVRVDREMFVLGVSGGADLSPEHREYLDTVFDVSLAMMLPKVKKDLGKHEFAYGAALADEFYPASGGEPGDALGLLQGGIPALDDDWHKVAKHNNTEVTEESFVEYFMAKHDDDLGRDYGKKASFEEYLKLLFLSARMAMVARPEFARGTIGGHGFRYAALGASEFYFDGTRGADTAGLVSKVDERWTAAHHVDRDMAHSFWEDENPAGRLFHDAVFQMSTAMMLPAQKKDLGRHSFSYGLLFAYEWYSADGSVPDVLGLTKTSSPCDASFPELPAVRKSLEADWTEVSPEGRRVSKQQFVNHYVKKFEKKLTGNGALASYKKYLAAAFFAGQMAMANFPKRVASGTLGAHCFKYAGLLAGEFHFSGRSGGYSDSLKLLSV